MTVFDWSELEPWVSNERARCASCAYRFDLNEHTCPHCKEPKMSSDHTEQPRTKDGQFTFKHGVRELKVVDKKGKHTHSIRRCKHCGHLNQIPSHHKGRLECSTCGEDPDRTLRHAKVVLAGPSTDDTAKRLGFVPAGRSAQGHRRYTFDDPSTGVSHIVIAGSGAHGKRAEEIDAQMARQRMTKCLNGQCMHTNSQRLVQEDEPGADVIRAGQTVMVNDSEHFVMEIDGGLALVLDTKTGSQDIVPVNELRVAAADPDWLFVYYMSEIHVVPYHHNIRYENLLTELLAEFEVDIDHVMIDLKTTDVAAGEVYGDADDYRVEHRQLSTPEVRDEAEAMLREWFDYDDVDVTVTEFWDGIEPDRDAETGQFVSS